MSCVISLTTIPSKFDNLYKTIDSLIAQTVVLKIIVNIPKQYTFRFKGEIPKEKLDYFMEKYGNFCVLNMVEDYGPGTKLLGLLSGDYVIQEKYVIIVDDDIIYKPYMVETFIKEMEQETDVSSFYVYNYNWLRIAQGVDGFLMKMDKLNHFMKYYDSIKNQDYIHYHDDFYFSYYFYLLNICVKHIHSPHIIYDVHDNTFTDALCNLHGKYSRNNLNDKMFDILNNLHANGSFDFLKTYLSLTAFLNSKGFHWFEGHSEEVPEQVEDLLLLTNKPNINVMEIGFNAGHSANIFLQNRSLTLTSFDLGDHDYVMTAKKYIDMVYPNRHTLIIGDSKTTVPEYKGTFDVIFIDGGHDYNTAKSDLENCFRLSHENTIVIIDDTIFTDGWEKHYTIGPTLVWMQALHLNKIKELNHKDYRDGRGMSWGVYKL